MKRKICAITIALLVIANITTITVLAKTIHSDWVEEKIKKGYTEIDAYSIMAVMALSDESVPTLIEQKYKKLGDWESVAEHYSIDIDEFNKFVEKQISSAEKLAIPDDIYAEMTASEMTDEECKELSMKASNAQFDIETVWEAHKNGKTVNDLIKESTNLMNQKGQTATDFVFGNMTEEEYIMKMQELSPEMPMSEIIGFAIKERREWMEFKKAVSGITDAELETAKEAGLTDFFTACRLKEMERMTNVPFKEMMNQIKIGKKADEVMKECVQLTKSEKTETSFTTK